MTADRKQLPPENLPPEEILSLAWLNDLERLAVKLHVDDVLGDLPHMTWPESWRVYCSLWRQEHGSGGA